MEILVSKDCKVSFTRFNLLFYNHFENTNYFTVNKRIIHSCCNSIGLAIYADPSFYSKNPNGNKDIHLPGIEKEDFLNKLCSFLQLYFQKHFSTKIKKIFIGHEHTDKQKLCFLQLVLTFEEMFFKTLHPIIIKFNYPSIPEINNFRFLCLKLKAKSQSVIGKYCTKPDLYFNNCLDNKEKKPQISFKTPFESPSLTKRNKQDNLVPSRNSSPAPLSDFWIKNEEFLSKYPLIRKWLDHYAIPSYLRTRKALLLYTESNNNIQYYKNIVRNKLECAFFDNTFQKETVFGNPKLVILNDMETYTLCYEDTWLGLLSGNESVIVCDDGTSYQWNYRIPCLVITKNKFLIRELFLNEKFKNLVVFQEIRDENAANFGDCEVDFSNCLFEELNEKTRDPKELQEEESKLKHSNSFNGTNIQINQNFFLGKKMQNIIEDEEDLFMKPQ